MGIRFYCPNGHKLNVKEFLAGKRGICPFCGASVQIPLTSTRPPSGKTRQPGGQSPSEPTIPGDPAPPNQPESQASVPSQPSQAPAPVTTQPSESQPDEAPTHVEPAGVQPEASPAAETPPAAVAPDAPAAPVVQQQTVAPESPVAPSPPPAHDAPPSSRPLDPFDEAPSAVWYVRPESGGQFGPATADVMRTWLAEGRIVAGSLVWREGWRDWQDATVTFPQLAADEELSALSEIAADAGSTVRNIAAGHHPPARRRDNTTNVTVIVLLILAVIVLLVVFYYVVM